jgi:hypothetical protein
MEARQINIQMRNMLCYNWQQIELHTPKNAQQQAAIAAVYKQQRCNP